jgi:hypothetical protein
MAEMREFLEQLLNDGKMQFSERPESAREPEPAVLTLLEKAYSSYRLEIAGPPIPFEAKTAWSAAELVRQAGWFLVSHDEPEPELESRLQLAGPPATAAQHLSADVTLRYLPQVHRRAQALSPDDLLVKKLTTILRQWPLSGVLADIEEEPLGPLDFDGHAGLCLLYAERLACHEKPAWQPRGPALEYVRWVWQELGKELSDQSSVISHQ